MKKFSLFLIIFLVFLGLNANASTLMLEDETQEITTLLGNKYTVTDRDKGNYGSYDETIGGYSSSLWTGYYIGTIISVNNDSTAIIEELISYYLDNSSYTIDSDKVDTSSTAASGTVGDLTVTWNEDLLTGTWTTLYSTDQPYIEFYSVKAANEFALYFLVPTAQDGTWTTTHLLTPNQNQTPAISHYTAVYDDPSDPPGSHAPEPGTMILLGFGLIGIAGIGRQKIKK